MPDQRYDATRKTIGELLSTTSPTIRVPDWQRSYAWTSEQVESFWADLLAFDKRYPDDNMTGEEYFLGSTVLVTAGATNSLLDGQQRLATSTILLAALRDARRRYKADSATRLQDKYITDFDDATGESKHKLTMNRYDRDFFREEIQEVRSEGAPGPKPNLRSHGLIRRAHAFFTDQIATRSEELGGGKIAFDWNLRIGDILCNHMSVVVVSSTDEDNAASVFETLNDRGIGLSTPDLLRNLLLRRASTDGARDQITDAWQAILEINDGASVDEFIRHYWVSHYGDVKARKLYREIKDRIETDDIDSLTLSKSLADSADIYQDLINARESGDEELRILLESIQTLKAKALYPALLSAYAVATGTDRNKDLRVFAKSLINLYIRHTVIGGRESTVMESTAYTVASNLRNDRDFEAATEAIASRVPSLADLHTNFQSCIIKSPATARYLLSEIEHYKRSTGELHVNKPERVHLEHIYPQTPQAGGRWPEHNSVINRIGNLTLLSSRLNLSIKNSPFKEKLATYSKSDIMLTSELQSYGDWSRDTIDHRQRDLSDVAVNIWCFPNEKLHNDLQDKPSDQSAALFELDNLPEVP